MNKMFVTHLEKDVNFEKEMSTSHELSINHLHNILYSINIVQTLLYLPIPVGIPIPNLLSAFCSSIVIFGIKIYTDETIPNPFTWVHWLNGREGGY